MLALPMLAIAVLAPSLPAQRQVLACQTKMLPCPMREKILCVARPVEERFAWWESYIIPRVKMGRLDKP